MMKKLLQSAVAAIALLAASHAWAETVYAIAQCGQGIDPSGGWGCEITPIQATDMIGPYTVKQWCEQMVATGNKGLRDNHVSEMQYVCVSAERANPWSPVEPDEAQMPELAPQPVAPPAPPPVHYKLGTFKPPALSGGQ